MGAIDLAIRVLSGDRRACARLITLVEDRDPAGLAELRRLPAGSAFRVGLTGPPGAGKSTLADLLIKAARAAGETVGVLAIDPTSPYSGGAILGDRIRMQGHATDGGVFIRSMGSRGHLGGLAAATESACRILSAFGCTLVIVETVGTGQSEVEIASHADAVVLVLAPNAGDGIQVLKAGIMEIPDLFVINKGDVPGAAETAREVRAMLEAGDGSSGPRPRLAGTGQLGPTSGATGTAALGLPQHSTLLDAPDRTPRPAGTDGSGPTPESALSDGSALAPVDRIFVTRGLEALVESGVPDLWTTLQAFRPAPGQPAARPPHREAVLSEALEMVRERLLAAGPPEFAPGDDLRAAAERWLSRLSATVPVRG